MKKKVKKPKPVNKPEIKKAPPISFGEAIKIISSVKPRE